MRTDNVDVSYQSQESVLAVLSDSVTLTGRNLRRFVRVPTLVAFSTVQPVLFVLLFTFVFSGAISPPGVDEYIDYLLPGLVVLSLAFGASQTGVAVASDVAEGMMDRFRSLPMSGAAVLAGRTAADAVRNLFVVLLMAGVGYTVDFQFHGTLSAALTAVVLAMMIGVALSMINAVLGLVVADAETANLASILLAVPLVFTSSTFVPIATMPDWLQAFAEVNPVTVTVDALRALTLGRDAADAIRDALIWIIALVAICLPIGGLRYRRASKDS